MPDELPNVLVIDDSKSTLNLVRGYLETMQLQISTATSVAEGLAKARECPPDLILSDIVMPIQDGYDLIEELRVDPSLSNIPVVLMTGVSAMQDRLKAVNSGADDLLTKPYDRAELVSRVTALLRLKQREDEIRQANANLNERMRLLSTLFIISSQLRESLDAKDILRVINETLVVIAGGEKFTIYLREAEAESFRLVVSHGLKSELFPQSITIPELPEPLSEIVENRQPYYPDQKSHSDLQIFGEPLLAAVPVVAMMPLVAQDRVIGLINIHAFSTETRQALDYELLTLISVQTSGAINAVNVVDQLKKYAAELEQQDQSMRETNKTLEEELFHFNTLTLFSAQLHSTIILSDIYGITRDLAVNFIGAQAFYTRYVSEWGEPSTFVGIADNTPGGARQIDTERYPEIEELVMNTRVAFFEDAPDPQFEHLISEGTPAPLACLPLVVEDTARGVLVIEGLLPHKNGFTNQDYDLLALLTREATLAIHNGHLHRQVKRLSATDGLTGAYNRRYFDQRIKDELRRAQRYENPLTLVMLDVDDFKSINDQYGHLVGDVVLMEIVRRCKRILRDVDVVCRYGGDEFALLLPETNRDSASLVSERLLVAFRNEPVQSDEVSIPVFLSLGIATATPQSDPTSLINAADQALLIAKRSGKNIAVARNRMK